MPHHVDIRPADPGDEQPVARLALDNDMFTDDEMDDLVQAFRDAVSGDLPAHQWFVATDPGDARSGAGVDAGAVRVAGAAYVAPEPFSDRLWNLYFLAVDPAGHGRGTGTALVAHVEHLLRTAGEEVARVLLVETSSTEQYAATRAFYLARGFAEEARIREFYGPGDDKVVFWKRLA